MNYVNNLKKLLIEFENEKIHYCILRNYEFLSNPKLELPKDVDMTIARNDLQKAHKILAQNGFKKRIFHYTTKHLGYAKFISKDFRTLSLGVEAGGLFWNDLFYLKDTEIGLKRQKKSFFYVLSDEDYFLMFFHHSVLGKRMFKPKYELIMKELFLKKNFDKQYLQAVFKRSFGKKYTKKIMILLEKEQYQLILKMKRELINKFIFKNVKSIILFTRVFLKWIVFQNKHWFLRAPLISVIGMDGSGKTTTTKNIMQIFKDNDLSAKLIYTGRGSHNILPISFFGRPYKKLEKKVESKKKNKNTLLKKVIYSASAPIFALDLFLRYIFRVMPARKKYSVVITDRYAFDLLLMDNVPLTLRKILYCLFPKPTLIIYLYNDLNVLHKRRPTHPILDLERQKKLFDGFQKTLNFVCVKTEDKQRTSENVSEIIFNYLLDNTFS
ncbi:MAG: hypothetical protein ABIC91_08985 [Nanoarchaeota archaeon]|nr:hypothetical protein [Nanoarchaeota archaeon]MBU1029968.1 hypothetical protein [Nanoarchaeota archaeon]MBU1849261.1 hypothetical protein [Nanoarchaeota archaeon]